MTVKHFLINLHLRAVPLIINHKCALKQRNYTIDQVEDKHTQKQQKSVLKQEASM